MEHLEINEWFLKQYRQKKMNARRLVCSTHDKHARTTADYSVYCVAGAYIFLLLSSRALCSKSRVSLAWLINKPHVIQAKE